MIVSRNALTTQAAAKNFRAIFDRMTHLAAIKRKANRTKRATKTQQLQYTSLV